MEPEKLEYLLVLFGSYNVVIVEIGEHLHFQVMAWGLSLPYGYNPISELSKFNGPEEIFRRGEHNALAFRQNLQRWPSGKSVKALFMTTLLPPYSFMLRIDEGKRYTIASTRLVLLNLICNTLKQL